MPESSEAGPSSGESSSQRAISRRRSSSTRSVRSRPPQTRAPSSFSQRSDASNISSGIQQLSWTAGDCFDYVDDDARISAFLHCPICLGPFLEPYASSVCSHTFCKQCITTALSIQRQAEDDTDLLAAPTSKRCPTCRTTLDLSDFQPTALLIKNMVDALRVRCPNKHKGCDYECERHLLRGHVASDCAFEYVDQNLTEGKRCGCSAKVMRKDWATHGLSCPKRKVACPSCDTLFCFDELEKHSQTCSPEPVVCEFCRLVTIKSRLTLHITNDCEEAPVLCPHSAFGCSWIGPRRRLTRHADTASKSTEQTHLEDQCRFEPLKAFFDIFSQHVNSLKEENTVLKAHLDDLQSRQLGQARRVDDCVHSLGSWYRSAGELRSVGLEQRASGSQIGVDGEWDEFPLDSQNWERSLSQQSFGARQSRAQSASGIPSMDLATWARRQYSDLSSSDLLDQANAASRLPSQRVSSSHPSVIMDDGMYQHSSPRYLAPPAASRSMPSTTSSRLASHTPSPSRERMSYLGGTETSASATTRRSATSTSMLTPLEASSAGTSALSPLGYTFPAGPLPDSDRDAVDRSNLDAAISSLTASVAGLSSGLSSLDKRTDEGHIAAVKAGFDAGRVQEEVASLRHGLHAVRMQIHQILMQQQRHALFSSPSSMAGLSPTAAAAGGAAGTATTDATAGPSHLIPPAAGLPMLSPPLLRRWAGLEHTKL
ncbi:uncharacterized protein SPSC_06185 [Sporisorium scitamineum]|uniref:RING-type domain-containing protein n=1 Tax=Sporisorium scitamineum TaxID=49012 RepID=A0A0F7SB10_9BASI|nr:uncharacterized protein SPSC_06185 [Sporisorium scitamineum]CDW98025.1 hypothetical protein [Sporisorium scitamineum]